MKGISKWGVAVAATSGWGWSRKTQNEANNARQHHSSRKWRRWLTGRGSRTRIHTESCQTLKTLAIWSFWRRSYTLKSDNWRWKQILLSKVQWDSFYCSAVWKNSGVWMCMISIDCFLFVVLHQSMEPLPHQDTSCIFTFFLISSLIWLINWLNPAPDRGVKGWCGNADSLTAYERRGETAQWKSEWWRRAVQQPATQHGRRAINKNH